MPTPAGRTPVAHTPPHADAPAIALIGMGPRGVSTLERIIATHEATNAHSPLHIHVIDPWKVGAGEIWRPDQTPLVCMNTLAGAVTLYTEPGATITGPIRPGPTMYQWIVGVRTGLYQAELPPHLREELHHTRPESHPSRALYGTYIRWVYQHIPLPDGVTITEHHARATSITANGDTRDVITLDDGSTITADATVYAPGWIPNTHQAPAGARRWIGPGNPIDQDLDAINPGDNLLIRGLGMGFFDAVTLLTQGRGGRFDHGRYIPSGKEPRIRVTSRRGYPFLPKSEYEALPPQAPLRRMKAAIADHAGAERVDFSTTLFPAIIKDAYEAYYRALERITPGALAIPIEQIIARIDAAGVRSIAGVTDTATPDSAFLPWALDGVTVDPADQWNHLVEIDPLAEFDGDTEQLQAFMHERLATDVLDAARGTMSARKAALWTISACRKPAAVFGEQGRYTLESSRGDFATLMDFGQMVGSGPPAFRTRELLALAEAGVVSFVLPQNAAAAIEQADVMLDAFLPSPDIHRSADPLIAGLRADGRLQPFAYDGVSTASPDVDPRTRLLAGDPRVHLIGIPTHAQYADTTISPMPGTDPTMLRETDAAARSALAVACGHDWQA